MHTYSLLFRVQDSYLMSQKSLRWRRALSPRKSSLQEEWVLRGLTLHQLKDIITDIYASKHKADARYCDSMQAIITVIYASKNKADARYGALVSMTPCKLSSLTSMPPRTRPTPGTGL